MKIPTYQEQLNFVDRGFAVVSVNAHLSTFKYSRKVMYDNLWNKIPGILECRGSHISNKKKGGCQMSKRWFTSDL